MSLKSHEFSLPFIRKEQIAKDIYSFYFDRLAKPDYEFQAGQYVRFLLDLPVLDAKGYSRVFTICSAPDQKDTFMITTQVVAKPTVFKQALMSLKKGDSTRFFGPMGWFILPVKSERPLVFLCGGIGITPFHSMVLQAAATDYKTPITLIASFSTSEEMIFYEELMTVSESHKNINVIYTISSPDKLWKGEKGRISHQLLKKNIPDIMAPDYFLCGPSQMVGSMLDLLGDMGVPDDQVREEQFTGY